MCKKMGCLGIVTGVGGGNFAPNNTLTREQAAVMIARLAYAIGQPLPPAVPSFADNAQISSWAVDGVGQMQASGIMGIITVSKVKKPRKRGREIKRKAERRVENGPLLL
jgi:hypothetical protein